jgi:hypothetical protein
MKIVAVMNKALFHHQSRLQAFGIIAAILIRPATTAVTTTGSLIDWRWR